MTNGPDSQREAAQRVSQAVDGECDAAAWQALTSQWRDDASTRATWHAFQLIGDVLRSEDLASAAAHDAVFLQRLRTRLAEEPVVLAPSAPAVPMTDPAPQAQVAVARAAAGRGRWRGYSAPIAVTAGFLAVAAALLVTQSPGGESVPAMASAEAPTVASLATEAPATATSPLREVSTRAGAEEPAAPLVLIRDPRLEQYLAAHQQFAGSTALGVPSGFLRSATVDVPRH